jgi:hypothetical protein
MSDWRVPETRHSPLNSVPPISRYAATVCGALNLWKSAALCARAAAGAQFKTGKGIQVDPANRSLAQKFIGCTVQKVEASERDYVIVLQHIFSFRCWFP